MQSVLFPESRNIYKNNIINKLLSKRRAVKSSPFSVVDFEIMIVDNYDHK